VTFSDSQAANLSDAKRQKPLSLISGADRHHSQEPRPAPSSPIECIHDQQTWISRRSGKIEVATSCGFAGVAQQRTSFNAEQSFSEKFVG